MPKGYGIEPNEVDVTLKDSDRSYAGLEIYKLAESLDTSLVVEYVQEGKKIDVGFVVELYKMVDKHLNNAVG